MSESTSVQESPLSNDVKYDSNCLKSLPYSSTVRIE